MKGKVTSSEEGATFQGQRQDVRCSVDACPYSIVRQPASNVVLAFCYFGVHNLTIPSVPSMLSLSTPLFPHFVTCFLLFRGGLTAYSGPSCDLPSEWEFDVIADRQHFSISSSSITPPLIQHIVS
ncbi:hypothetical protein Agabi119p4_621 [Agaricus bisporus var. burnettii]|uniref:Uncharacterized protein n=1 Tax=Agaricus bisporus var. burnettii TaxID=192524 RepID=A0A8H7FB79_AGABI|nr:hypothetical protein Agabi119p4_621 [Agaricus bisporus var. burnettii]